MEKSPVALLISSSAKRHEFISRALKDLNLRVETSRSCREAQAWLQKGHGIGVVVTDVSLPDGNWCDVLRLLVDSGRLASLVVTASYANERLWSEILWRGAHDLLVEPCEPYEARRIIESAWRASAASDEARLIPPSLWANEAAAN